jgi:hypothetical protein
MPKEQITYIPFNAINEFMLDEYRLKVIQVVFQNSESLLGQWKSKLTSLVKRYIQVPGFRNSTLAPVGIKIKNSIKPFERNADFTACILMCWGEVNDDLRRNVFEMLTSRTWEMLPPDADRTALPGFLSDWPEGESYDTLDAAFAENYPDNKFSTDDIRLMVVWLSGRLPYGVVGEAEDDDVVESITP